MVKAIVSGPAGRMGGRIIHLMEAAAGITLAGACEQPDHAAVGKDVGEVVGLPRQGSQGGGLPGRSPGAGGGGHRVHPPRAVAAPSAGGGGRRQGHGPGNHRVFPGPDRRDPRPGGPDPPGVRPQHERRGEPDVQGGGRRRPGAGGGLRRRDRRGPPPPEKGRRPAAPPSKLAQVIAHALGRDLEKVGVYARRGIIGERRPEEIGIQTVRAGDIVGEHTVLFGGIGERLEIIHRAHSRDNFARGALRAAQWVVAQPPACYDMQDVLGLK